MIYWCVIIHLAEICYEREGLKLADRGTMHLRLHSFSFRKIRTLVYTVRKLAANSKVKSCSLQSPIWTPYYIARDTNFIQFESIALVDYVDVVRSVKICMMNEQ